MLLYPLRTKGGHRAPTAAVGGGVVWRAQPQHLWIITGTNTSPPELRAGWLPCNPLGRSIVFTSSSAMSKAFSPLNFFSQKSCRERKHWLVHTKKWHWQTHPTPACYRSRQGTAADKGWSHYRRALPCMKAGSKPHCPINSTPQPDLLPRRRLSTLGAEHHCLWPGAARQLCFHPSTVWDSTVTLLLLFCCHVPQNWSQCRTHESIISPLISPLSWHFSLQWSHLILNAALQALLELKGKRSSGLVGRWIEKLGTLSSLSLPVKGWSVNGWNVIFLAIKQLYPGWDKLRAHPKQARHISFHACQHPSTTSSSQRHEDCKSQNASAGYPLWLSDRWLLQQHVMAYRRSNRTANTRSIPP